MAGRALQGASAAFMAPAALALIASTFTEPRERGKAFGVFGAVASSGAVVGLLLGGVLTEYAGWRWCLYVNVLVAAVVITAARRVLPKDDGYPVPVDVVSGVLATAGLAGLVLGASEAAAHGWGSAEVLVPGLVGLALLGAFLLRQRGLAAPLLPLTILRDRGRATAYAATAISVVGTFGMFLMLTYHFQVVLGYSPVRTGLAFLPMCLAVAGSSYGIASRLMHRVAPRALVAPGLLVAAGGLALLTQLDAVQRLRHRDPARPRCWSGSASAASSRPRSGSRPAASTRGWPASPPRPRTRRCRSEVAWERRCSTPWPSSATRDFVGAPTAALVHGFATATGGAAVALVVGAALVVAFLRPAAPAHHQTTREVPR